MSVKDKISADLKEAMKAKDQVRVDTLRSALSAITYKRVEIGKDLSEDEMISVLQKQVKQRNDSIAEYKKGRRSDLVAKETREHDILAGYLPAQKSEEEIRAVVRAAMSGLPEDKRNQGGLMKEIMPHLKGVADGNLVRRIVSEEMKAG